MVKPDELNANFCKKDDIICCASCGKPICEVIYLAVMDSEGNMFFIARCGECNIEIADKDDLNLIEKIILSNWKIGDW